MKRLALVLAAALSTALGAGCGPAPCARNVTVDWSGGFLGADGVKRGCAAAGVVSVDLYVNGDAATAARFDCSAFAAQAVDVPPGSNVYTVEGIEGSGRIAYRAEVSAGGCGNQTVPVAPAEGTLALDYSFSPVNACDARQPTYVWSKVRDDVAGQTAFVDTEQSSATLCSTANPTPTFLLPAGSYTLVGVNEWSPTNGYVAHDCTRRGFEIGGGTTTTVSPVLVDGPTACF